MLTGKGIWTNVSKRFAHSTAAAGLSPALRSLDLSLTDVTLLSSFPTTNQEGSTNVNIGDPNLVVGQNSVNRLWIKPNFSSIPNGSALISATLKLTPVTDLSDNARTMYAHRCLRNVVNTQTTWNVYSTGNNWGTAGCSNSTTDYDGAVVLGSMTQPASPTLNSPLSMTLDIAEFVKLYDGTYTNNGIILFVDTQIDDLITYAATENATPSYRPVISITYY